MQSKQSIAWDQFNQAMIMIQKTCVLNLKIRSVNKWLSYPAQKIDAQSHCQTGSLCCRGFLSCRYGMCEDLSETWGTRGLRNISLALLHFMLAAQWNILHIVVEHQSNKQMNKNDTYRSTPLKLQCVFPHLCVCISLPSWSVQIQSFNQSNIWTWSILTDLHKFQLMLNQ